jgi:branched-chain amino acid transport system substrate-binding protein
LYDGVNIVAQAMAKANSIEPAQYRAALANIDSRGVSGHYQFDKNRDLTDSPITIYHYRNGEPTPLASAQP